MFLHRNYPLFKSQKLKSFAIYLKRKGPHISSVKCLSCGIVFANPMADEHELVDYYQNYYQKDLYEAIDYKNHILDHFNRIKKLDQIGIQVAEHFAVKTYQGDIWGANYPDNLFDFIHISHVIEHVLDPVTYLQEMKRIFKPGGRLAIGTPDSSSALYDIHRIIHLLALQVPDIVDGLEHTFIFPKKTLAHLCEREGLKIEDHYTHNLGEKLKNLISHKMSLAKKINRLLQNAFHVNQWIICVKN